MPDDGVPRKKSCALTRGNTGSRVDSGVSFSDSGELLLTSIDAKEDDEPLVTLGVAALTA